jgi:hypothetical protein
MGRFKSNLAMSKNAIFESVMETTILKRFPNYFSNTKPVFNRNFHFKAFFGHKSFMKTHLLYLYQKSRK